jgi:hypothetical protein
MQSLRIRLVIHRRPKVQNITISDSYMVITRWNEEHKSWDANMDKSFYEDCDPEEVIRDETSVLSNNEKATSRLSEDENITILIEEHENMDTPVYASFTYNSDPKEVIGDEVDVLSDDSHEEAAIWICEDENKNVEKVNPVKIKLRPLKPGSKIADLTNIIENKLNRRNSLKPAGGVDPLVFATNDVDTVCSLYIDDEELVVRKATVELAGNIQGTSLWGNNRWPDYAATI